MNEIKNQQNINSHYSTNAKVERPALAVASAPANLPRMHLFNNKDAENRLKQINQDIYTDSKKEENKHGIKFLKIFGLGIGLILIIKGFKNLKNTFKKS